jgi:mono/diheme cytochrome c family protein
MMARSVHLIGALVVVWLAIAAPQAKAQAPVDPLIAKGEYLAKAGDCTACHTAPGGKAFAGGLAIASPVGVIYASNITPSKTAGIGLYTRDQFAAALRKGIRRDGANLYPAMPYTAYAIFSDRDVDALYAYFLKGVAPVDVAPPPTRLPFPMNIRLSMKAWNLIFFRHRSFQFDPAQSAAWNRGRYLVDGAAHCSTCHTPRGFLMEERPGLAFAGGHVGAWYAPNITSDKTRGVGSWSKSILVDYLRNGVAPGARAAGTMGEAIEHSFRYLTPADLDAVATYIGTVPPAGKAEASDRFGIGQPSSKLTLIRGPGPTDTDAAVRGAMLFQGNCASCHAPLGQGGRDGYFPSLFHNSTTGAANSNLVATILNGVNRTTAGVQAFMPGFGGRPTDANQLSNHDVALIATYVRTQYGAGGPDVTDKDVATVRQGGPSSPLVLIARLGLALAVAMAAIVIFLLLRRPHRPKLRVR